METSEVFLFNYEGVVRCAGRELAGQQIWCQAFVRDARVGAGASSPEPGWSSGPGAGRGRRPDARCFDL